MLCKALDHIFKISYALMWVVIISWMKMMIRAATLSVNLLIVFLINWLIIWSIKHQQTVKNALKAQGHILKCVFLSDQQSKNIQFTITEDYKYIWEAETSEFPPKTP